MKIGIANDHRGYKLKLKLVDYLKKKGYEVIDYGTDSTVSVDYPDYGAKVGRIVAKKEADFGIVCCGSAEGISISANKIKGIRCGIGYNDEVSKLLRQHNDANMIAFAGRFMKVEEVLPRVDLFLSTPFEGGRHVTRVEKISALEKQD